MIPRNAVTVPPHRPDDDAVTVPTVEFVDDIDAGDDDDVDGGDEKNNVFSARPAAARANK